MKMKLVCEVCQKEFERTKGEVNRNLKKGRRIFCSRSCAGHHSIKNIAEHSKEWKHLNPANQRDEFTPFREFLRSIKRRDKDYDLTLFDIKEQWEKQNGICPYTGWELILETGNRLPKQASLDRIDSSKGYIKGNIQFVAYIANIAKSTYDEEVLFNFCKAVTKKAIK